jgi:hypothetical protein
MRKLLTFCITCTVLQASAQIDSCNVFLQGNHVEVGISPVGSYGSSVGAPAGYHGNVTDGSIYNSSCGHYSTGSNHLGFVADIDKDGWTVGTPAYFGDYFLPGSPYEGWEMAIGGSVVKAINTDSTFTGTLSASGSNISYSNIGGVITSTWQGMVDSVQLTQVTTIDSGNLFFTTQVTLTNLSVSPVNDIYYFRSLDPDNEEVQTGTFTTINTIAHQSPDTTVVTATGTTYSTDILGLGTTDTSAHCLVYADWPLPDTTLLSSVYNQTYSGVGTLYAQGASDTVDFAIGLVFSIPHLATVDSAADSVARTTASAGMHPANSATFTFFYSFGKAGMDSALSTLSKQASTSLAIKNINAATEVKVYPNPTANFINVTGLNPGDQLSLIDMMGRTSALPGNGTSRYSISNFVPGNYILVITDADGNVRSRIRVQKQ